MDSFIFGLRSARGNWQSQAAWRLPNYLHIDESFTAASEPFQTHTYKHECNLFISCALHAYYNSSCLSNKHGMTDVYH